MDSYWELYLAYIRHCERQNKQHDIDPHHYEMEWNHTLPRCIFGDQPLGQWLTLRQHAIASALQTLVFNRNCMYGRHLKILPSSLYCLVSPIFSEASRKAGLKVVESQVGICSPVYKNSPEYIAVRRINGKRNGRANGLKTKERKLGIFSPESRAKNAEKIKELKSKRVQVTYPDGRVEEYPSAQETARVLGLFQSTISYSARNFTTVSRGNWKGYSFRYV